ncbi:MAG: hypothetical protein ACRDRG_18595 [Pseudonocardiaceae bacterium]
MTDSEATQQSPGTDPDPSADQTTANIEDPDSSADQAARIEEAGEEGVAADYETRLREFDDVDSVPIVSVPVQSSELERSDLEVQSPSSQSE